MKLEIAVTCLVFGLNLLPACHGEGEKWPEIRPVQAERTFVDGGSGGDTPFLLLVSDTSRTLVDQLECHNGDYDSVSGFNFSGDFHCALFALNAGVVTSHDLLASEEEAKIGRDWFNRGRMLASQLWPSCGLYPEYGAIRHFRLRGMVITLRFDALKWFPFERFQRHRLEAFRFKIVFMRDPDARSVVAEAVKDSVPPTSCGW